STEKLFIEDDETYQIEKSDIVLMLPAPQKCGFSDRQKKCYILALTLLHHTK
ncbi:hypothetical protein ILUMI_16060, partial [Ignelater luminosus]